MMVRPHLHVYATARLLAGGGSNATRQQSLRTTSAGVDGCSQSRTYVYSGTQGIWVLDAVNGEPASSKQPVSNDHAKKEANQ